MAKHMVKCLVCGEVFDANQEEFIKINARRYAHSKCCPNGELPEKKQEEEEKTDLVKLKDYIQKLFGKDNVRWPLVMKQIQQYKDENGYTYSGMLKSLVWFYEIKGNHVEFSKGVGIIPFAYQDAYNYYYALFVAQSQNEQKDFNQITSHVREITIKPPEIKKKVRLFNEENEDE